MKEEPVSNPSLRKNVKKHSGLRLVKCFFKCYDLVLAKEVLYTIMTASMKRKARICLEPSDVLDFYLSVRSFVRGCYLLQFRHKKWLLSEPEEITSSLMLGSLSEEEYEHPFRVFKNAFREYTIEELDGFITEVSYFSLGAYDGLPHGNVGTPFIHLNKMMDAAWVVLERVE